MFLFFGDAATSNEQLSGLIFTKTRAFHAADVMEAAAATATLAADGDVAPARPRPVSARSVYEALKKARLADESRKKKTKAAPAPKYVPGSHQVQKTRFVDLCA